MLLVPGAVVAMSAPRVAGAGFTRRPRPDAAGFVSPLADPSAAAGAAGLLSANGGVSADCSGARQNTRTLRIHPE